MLRTRAGNLMSRSCSTAQIQPSSSFREAEGTMSIYLTPAPEMESKATWYVCETWSQTKVEVNMSEAV